MRDLIAPAYLAAVLNSAIVRRQVDRLVRGVAQKTLNLAALKSVIVPLPALREQQRIVDILDRADALRAKRRAALALLDTLTQSIFIDMLGEPTTNSMGWPWSSMGQLGANEDSVRIPVKAEDRQYRSGPYPYYGASGIIDWVDGFLFEGERLLVAEDGANLESRATPVAFIAVGRYWVNNHAHVIAQNQRAELRFLECVLMQLDLKPYLSGTAQPKLTRSSLDRIPVPLPPLALQREFSMRAAAVDKLKAAHRASLAQLDALFASLQHRAFRGEL